MHRALLFFAACLFVLLGAERRALAQGASPAPLYVVDVRGEHVDVERIRAGVSRELAAEVISPEDPRAASATGTLEVETNAEHQTLTVTFRKLETPVVRTVPLPGGVLQAERAAVFLAGNLARDEAKEILGGMKKEPAPPAKTPSDADVAANARDDEELRLLRVTLQVNAEQNRRRTRALWAGMLGFGGVSAGTGGFLAAYHRTPGSAQVGWGLVALAADSLLLTLVWDVEDARTDAVLETKLAEVLHGSGASSTDTLDRVDAAWQERAREAASVRKRNAIIPLVAGAIVVGVCTTFELTWARGDESKGGTEACFLSGAAGVGLGVYRLLSESTIERDFESWHRTRRRREPMAATVRPSIGFAPLARGGAAQVGFTF